MIQRPFVNITAGDDPFVPKDSKKSLSLTSEKSCRRIIQWPEAAMSNLCISDLHNLCIFL